MSSTMRLSDLVKIAAHMWFGPYLPKIPRSVKPVRPTGFLKHKLNYLNKSG